MRNKMAKLFSKIAVFAIAITLAFGFLFNANTVGVKAEEPEIHQQTITQRIYQGENNWYYLTGDFSENQLYRMYFNTANNWWQGYGHLGNTIAGDYNTLYPYLADAMLAYVVPEFGMASIYGRSILTAAKDFDVKIVHRSVDGVDTTLYSATLNDVTPEGVSFEGVNVEVKAGDVIFFVVETNANIGLWEGVTFDAVIDITKKAGKSEGAKNALITTAMPMTGAHTITVTEGFVDHQGILTESMKLKQGVNDRQKYAYRGTDGGFALFDYDANGGDTPYRLAGMNFDGCSTGINVYRVFYANNGWTGAAGMIYYMPNNGFASVLGKAVVGGTADIVKVTAAGAVTVVKTLTAGEYDFASVAEINNIPVGIGDFVGVFFDGTAWTTSSFAGAFDFYSPATVATETVVAATGLEVNCDGMVEGALIMTEEDEVTATAIVTPNYATDTTVTWTVEGDAVTVENGVITAVKAGTAKVTVTANGNAELSKSIVVTVNAKEQGNTGDSTGDNTSDITSDTTTEESSEPASDITSNSQTETPSSSGCVGAMGATGFCMVLSMLAFAIIKSRKE